jgi:LPXTG-motif cell wall-anchored protein
VQHSVRKLTRIVIFGAIAGFAALPLLATSASAQSSGDAVCTFNVVPNPIAPPFPAAVHIEGTAPPNTQVTAFNGATPLVTTTTDGGGNFHSANFGVNPDTDVSATFAVAGGSYATGCADPEGLVVVRVKAATAAQAAQQAQALAFTGSNNTSTFVLIGIAALVVGMVLTVGARRRSGVSS